MRSNFGIKTLTVSLLVGLALTGCVQHYDAPNPNPSQTAPTPTETPAEEFVPPTPEESKALVEKEWPAGIPVPNIEDIRFAMKSEEGVFVVETEGINLEHHDAYVNEVEETTFEQIEQYSPAEGVQVTVFEDEKNVVSVTIIPAGAEGKDSPATIRYSITPKDQLAV